MYAGLALLVEVHIFKTTRLAISQPKFELLILFTASPTWQSHICNIKIRQFNVIFRT